MREYRHPQINYTFTIKEISAFEIEINGIRVHRKDCDWMVMMSNYGFLTKTSSDVTMHELDLPFLQTILGKK